MERKLEKKRKPEKKRKDKTKHKEKIEEILKQTEIVFRDKGFMYFEGEIERYKLLHEQYPEQGYNYRIESMQSELDRWAITPNQRFLGEMIKLNRVRNVNKIGYTLTVPKEFKKKNILVTTKLISVNDYSAQPYVYTMPLSVNYKELLSYKAGEVIKEETQKVFIGKDST